jgi:hypothetical protein
LFFVLVPPPSGTLNDKFEILLNENETIDSTDSNKIIRELLIFELNFTNFAWRKVTNN